jgi:TonB family protein
MRVLTPILFGLVTALLPNVAQAADSEGCADLKPFPRLEGCVIAECSAKPHDSFDTPDGSAGPLDANVNTLAYSCPASMDLQRVKRELDAEVRKAGYQSTAEDKTDPANPVVTARKGAHWLRWSATSEDGSTSYSLTLAESSNEKFKAETCTLPPVFSSLKQCEVVECASKSEDSVALRTAQKAQTSLTGNVQAVTLACPAIGPAQAFATAEGELRTSGFEILFSDREHPESAWMTGRAGQRWVELVSAPDGEAVSYTLTVVPSAEVLTASAPPEPRPAGHPTPEPTPAPEPASTTAVVIPSAPVAPAPVVPTPIAVPAPAVVPAPTFVAPKPIFQVPIEPTHERIFSVHGEVVIDLLVNVSEDGSVTEAVFAGKITRDVRKLQSAALDAIWRWRFEPARQDGRIVAAVKIPVQIRFRGQP